MSRPETTIIAVVSGRVARLDTGGRGAPAFFPGTGGDQGPAPAFDEALKLERLAPRVFVLSDEVRLVAVELAARAIAGLSDAQLSDAAAFEAEAVGGLAAATSVTSARRQPGAEGRGLIVAAQFDRESIAALAAKVRARGGRLVGLAHPGGLPQRVLAGEADPLSPDAPATPWIRLELWRDEVILVHGSRDGVGSHPLGLTPASQWQRELQRAIRSRADLPELDVLAAPGIDPPPARAFPADASVPAGAAGGDPDAPDRPGVRLDEHQHLLRFLTLWSRRLGSTDPGVPLLTPPKPASRRRIHAVAGFAAAGAVAAAIWHHESGTRAGIAQLSERITLAEREQRGLEQARSLIAELQTRRAALRADAERARPAPGPVASPRPPPPPDLTGHLAALLSELESAADPAWVVRSIAHASPAHTVTGLAASSHAVTGLAQRLSRRLSETWTVSPAVITPEFNGQDVAWRFSIALEPRLAAATEGTP